MLYSRPCEYALRAITYMGTRTGEGMIRVQEIAQAEGLPAPFLAKVLQQLTRAGILNSVKGPRGGFGFSRPPDKISVFEVVAAVDGTEAFDRCAVGLAECADDSPCPLHDTWKPLRLRITEYLTNLTVSDLAVAIRRKRELIQAARANPSLPISSSPS